MDVEERIGEKFEEWLRKGETHLEDVLENSDTHWDTFMKKELSEIEEDVATDPGKAFGRLASLAGFTGHASEKHPILTKVITGYIDKFVQVLRKLKHALGATSFSVSVSTPLYLSLGLTFS